MAGTYSRTDPTPVIVRQWVADGTGGATNTRNHPLITVSVPVPQSTASDGTADAGWVSWINPEKGTIIVTDYAWYLTATGTGGTLNAGVSSDGTGSNNNIVGGGTLTGLTLVRVARRGRTATEGAGSGGMQEWYILGPGGTGTNNSIVGKYAEVTSTAAGRVFISYIAIDT